MNFIFISLDDYYKLKYISYYVISIQKLFILCILDSNVNKQEKISRPHTTYEELRKQNRESYNRGVIYSAYTPEKSEG